jgi:hypothetical protein
LDLKEPECDASGRSNLIHIADESSPNTGPTFPDGMTCEPSPAKDSSAPTLSAAGSHAKTLATLDSGQELKESKADSGRVLRPRFVVVENVAALLGRGMDTVLGDLSSIGYAAEWDCLPASAFGAPHRRDRVWIVAHTDSERFADSQRRSQVAELFGGRAAGNGHRGARRKNIWPTQPDVVRMVHGVPFGVDRVASLGRSVVPQVAEWIGRRLMEFLWEERETE